MPPSMFVVGGVYESEGLRRYKIVSYDPEFGETPYLARYLGAHNNGRAIELDRDGQNLARSIKLMRKVN